MMTPKRIAEIKQFIRKYGSANCWTGTLGEACTIIHELLQELDNGSHHNANEKAKGTHAGVA